MKIYSSTFKEFILRIPFPSGENINERKFYHFSIFKDTIYVASTNLSNNFTRDLSANEPEKQREAILKYYILAFKSVYSFAFVRGMLYALYHRF